MRRLLLCYLFSLVLMVNLRADIQATFYVAPDGKGTIGSLGAPTTLPGARDLVRAINQKMTGDIIVYLRGGTYYLTAPFQLLETADIHDSGTNGYNIIYKPFPGESPVVSGGLLVTNWEVSDRDKNIYRAKVPDGTQSRQFYINDRRAIRARGPDLPDGWTKTDTGWKITDATMANWRNPSDIEIVSRNGGRHFRCGIQSITGTDVVMKSPGWLNCSKSPDLGNPHNASGVQLSMEKVQWLENAYELLTQPGQWYLDTKENYLYYMPFPGEDMSTATTVLAVLENVLDVHGTSKDIRIHNIIFNDITFTQGTWLQPSGDQGYADNRAGVTWVNQPPVLQKTLGNLSFQYAQSIQFQGNVVAHMGGVAIDFGHGAQLNSIIGNTIYDISGGGIFLGDVDDSDVTDANAWCDTNTIKDNYIMQIGVEYEDQVGICTGYTRNLVLDHNEVSNAPYTGISVGWGWGKPGYSLKNTISNNHVHDFMQVLSDGGGIYTLGNQGTTKDKTVWSGNYIHDGPHAQGLYADEGSAFMEITNNLVSQVGLGWIYIGAHSSHDLFIENNFSDKTSLVNNGQECHLKGNDMEVDPKKLPAAAQAIIKKAGLERSFLSVKDKIPSPTPIPTPNPVPPPI